MTGHTVSRCHHPLLIIFLIHICLTLYFWNPLCSMHSHVLGCHMYAYVCLYRHSFGITSWKTHALSQETQINYINSQSMVAFLKLKKKKHFVCNFFSMKLNVSWNSETIRRKEKNQWLNIIFMHSYLCTLH